MSRQMGPMRATVSVRIFSLLLLGLPLSDAAEAQVQAQVQPAAAVAPTRERARQNQRVFDRVWSEVRRSYYDPRLHGVDWDAARARFRPQALAASDERGLYRVINTMLDLLDDGHAAASPPAAVRRQDAQFARRAVMGLTLMRGETPDDWSVERIRPGSPAEAAGIELGWVLNAVDGQPWGRTSRRPRGDRCTWC